VKVFVDCHNATRDSSNIRVLDPTLFNTALELVAFADLETNIPRGPVIQRIAPLLLNQTTKAVRKFAREWFPATFIRANDAGRRVQCLLWELPEG
jgi:hypothetical protein